MGDELKFFDTAVSFLTDATGEIPASGQWTLIPQGDTESTRDGRKAVIKSIQFRGFANFVPAASTTGVDIGWFYVVLDTQTNGAAALITDVFTSSNMSNCMLNLNNSGRFKILIKKVITCKTAAGVSGAYANQLTPIEFYKRVNIPIEWSSTTGAISEIRSNNIFVCTGGVSDDVITIAGTARLRFYG